MAFSCLMHTLVLHGNPYKHQNLIFYSTVDILIYFWTFWERIRPLQFAMIDDHIHCIPADTYYFFGLIETATDNIILSYDKGMSLSQNVLRKWLHVVSWITYRNEMLSWFYRTGMLGTSWNTCFGNKRNEREW